MVTALYQRLTRHPLWATALPLFGAAMLCITGFEWRGEWLGPEKTLDGRRWYTPDEVRNWLGSLDPAERNLYAITELTLDVAFPLLYGSLFAVLIARLYGRRRPWMVLIPLLAVVADLLENGLAAYLAWSYNAFPDWVARIAAYSTATKWLMIFWSLGLAGIGAAAVLLRTARRGSGPARSGAPEATTRDDAPTRVHTVLAHEREYIRRHRHPDRERRALERNLVGLALSGGGIRAATTSLGILQGLSRMGILPMVDYLSTVSGGGYLGSCLSALLSWNDKTKPDPDDPRAPFTFRPGDPPRFNTTWKNFPLRAEEIPERGKPGGRDVVSHLRTHGNFLVARQGLFRRETMRSIGNLLTGILYNIAFFLLAILAVSALYVSTARGVAPVVDGVFGGSAQPPAQPAPARVSLVPVDSTISRVSTAGCTPDTPDCETRRITLRPVGVLDRVSHNARVMAAVFTAPDGRPVALFLLIAAAMGVACSIITFLLLRRAHRKYLTGAPPEWGEPERGDSEEDALERGVLTRQGVTLLLLAALTTSGASLLWRALFPHGEQLAPLFLPWAFFTGAWLMSLWLGVRLHGFGSVWTRRTRSLWGAFQSLVVYGWFLALAFALLPVLIYAVHGEPGELGMGALASLVITRLLTARRTGVPRRFALPSAARNALLGLAVAAVLSLLVLLFSVLVVESTDTSLGAFVWFSAALGIIAVLAFFVSHNQLSLHYFYRDRLAETYLRSEFPDTEGRLRLFHDAAEMPLSALHGDSADPDWRNTAPYQLINAAINLAGSRDLTRKDRKSGYWLFSKLYCGSVHTGFRRTDRYRNGDTKLARAMTISGAAPAPAIGSETFFAQAFAMVLFNVRAGYWLENPRDPESQHTPRRRVFWPWYLLREMTLHTTETTPLVNLSDGGYTGDNVGIYPLLQRRCKVIIACDAERDPNLTFGSFTQALRQAYVDEGIDVDIDLSMIRPDPVTGLSRSHCAVGRIRYPDRDEQESYLIYIKNSLTGDEPAPVLNYKSQHPVFPHESTADLFFDDDQFESYRALGVHLAEHTFGRWVTLKWFTDACAHHSPTQRQGPGTADGPPSLPLDEDALSRSWLRLQMLHTPFRATEQREYWTLTGGLRDIERLFLGEPSLQSYHEECFAPETRPSAEGDGEPEALPRSPEIDHVASVQAQFMEDVFYVLRLDRYANAPDNRGWMNLFRRWGRSPTFNRRLDEIRATLALDFLEFYDLYLRYYPRRIDEAPVPHPWDSRRHRRDPRSGAFLPPRRTGGKTAPEGVSETPEVKLLRGIYLDPGIREAGPESGELPQPQPGERVIDSSLAAAGAQSGAAAAPPSPSSVPNE